MNDYNAFLAEAFAWAVNDFSYHTLNENPFALVSVTNLKIYRGIEKSSLIRNDIYNHSNWQMWTTDKELAKIFGAGAGWTGAVLETSYSGQCVDLEKVYFQVLKDIKEEKIDLIAFPEINEALDTYRRERFSLILPPAYYSVTDETSDTLIVQKEV
jgi:hypothetical protein